MSEVQKDMQDVDESQSYYTAFAAEENKAEKMPQAEIQTMYEQF